MEHYPTIPVTIGVFLAMGLLLWLMYKQEQNK